MNGISWFPAGSVLPGGETIRAYYVGADRADTWQIYSLEGGGYALAADSLLYRRWLGKDLVEEGIFLECLPPSRQDKQEPVYVLAVPAGETVFSVDRGPFLQNSRLARNFGDALRATHQRTDAVLSNGIFVSRLSLVLPTFGNAAPETDDAILGRWVCGGMNVLLSDWGRIRKYAGWLTGETRAYLMKLFSLEETTGSGALVMPPSAGRDAADRNGVDGRFRAGAAGRSQERGERKPGPFCLPGREALERFFREEILDVIDKEEEYRKFGVGFPGGTILYGPPGSGKTYAVEKFAEYLGWPVYRINVSTIGSKYIHETSQLISGVFDAAIADAPSILIMDELEAFLSSREGLTGNWRHYMEEVDEFLRRIPEAAGHRVLMFGMTNMKESIDEAFLRKGRFDHILEIGMPSREEVRAVLESILKDLPTKGTLDLDRTASYLEGRPMSDVAFVVREAGRISVRERKDGIDNEALQKACIQALPEQKKKRRIGF